MVIQSVCKSQMEIFSVKSRKICGIKIGFDGCGEIIYRSCFMGIHFQTFSLFLVLETSLLFENCSHLSNS